MMAVLKRTIKLNSGQEMPIIGLGTYRVYGRELIFSVIEAGLQSGYRAIDTAAVYHNEEDIGSALKEFMPKHNLTRKDIFLTSKLAPSDHGRDKVTRAVQKSLTNLNTTYLDLYLVHWPGVSGIPVDSPDNAKLRLETWRELVALHKEGLLHSIGVSNYTENHLKALLANCYGVKPAVNQVEYHPHYRQPALLELCRQNNIHLQAYCSLGGSSDCQLLEDAVVRAVADRLGRSPAQVLLRWALEQDIGIIPKSVNPDRIAANLQLDFQIPDKEMSLLNSLSVMMKYAWDPTTVA